MMPWRAAGRPRSRRRSSPAAGRTRCPRSRRASAAPARARRSSRRGGPAGRCGGASRSSSRRPVPGATARRLPGWPTPLSELELALADAGGADAPRDSSARLRDLLDAELRRGVVRARRVAHRLRACRSRWRSRPRDGEVLAALPIAPELRADPGAVGERAGALAAAAVEQRGGGRLAGPAALAARSSRLAARRAGRDARARLPGGRAGRGGRVRARGARRGVRGEADRPPAGARAPAARPRAGGASRTCARRSARRTRCAWPRR